jgi:1-deoxy-D-xylulose-5-phosphate synthase
LNKIKPISPKVCDVLSNAKQIYFYEEGIRTGGVGECFASLLQTNGVKAEFHHICIDDEFVKQASVESQLKHYGLDAQSIINEVNNTYGK